MAVALPRADDRLGRDRRAHAAMVQAKDPKGPESDGSHVQSHTHYAKQNPAIHRPRPSARAAASGTLDQSTMPSDVSDIFLSCRQSALRKIGGAGDALTPIEAFSRLSIICS